MGMTIANTKRDGNLCVAEVTVTSGGGNATTTEDVIGSLFQIEVTNTDATSNAFTFTMEDTANNMLLFSGTIDSDDILTFNNGSGAYCRGPLKVAHSGTAPSVPRTINIYYEKL
tara:strand:+ start:939 stop:1280 length:342 start_codon:yes stop_codon:yes gene_type:complete